LPKTTCPIWENLLLSHLKCEDYKKLQKYEYDYRTPPPPPPHGIFLQKIQLMSNGTTPPADILVL
jgi:hypothetical protein